MRLLIQYPQYGGVGGIARYLEGFLENIPHNEHLEITLLTGESRKITKIKNRINIITVPFNERKLSSIRWSLRCRKIIQTLHNKKEIDIINLHIPPLIPGLPMPQVPYVVTAHSTYFGMGGKLSDKQYYNKQYSNLEKFIRLKIEKLIFKNALKIICLTPRVKEELKAYGIKADKIEICPNGVDCTFFKTKEMEKDIDLLFVGRLEAMKGSRSLIRLCKLLVKNKSDIKIYIVGYGNDFNFIREKLQDEVKKANVLLTGKVPFSQARQYYDRSKIYTSTSYYEGLPGTCLEAMSMQLPVIVWDMPFYTGLVENGKSGYLIPVNNYSLMQKKILSLLEARTNRRSMGKYARRKVLKEYSWRKLAPKLLNIMSQLS
jgi:glycosyltransferase involved in cell wall biosynthesis